MKENCVHCGQPMKDGPRYTYKDKPVHWLCRKPYRELQQSQTIKPQPPVHPGDDALWYHDNGKSVFDPRPCKVVSVAEVTAKVRFWDKTLGAEREARVSLSNLKQVPASA